MSAAIARSVVAPIPAIRQLYLRLSRLTYRNDALVGVPYLKEVSR
jgi:hypothetical protein